MAELGGRLGTYWVTQRRHYMTECKHISTLDQTSPRITDPVLLRGSGGPLSLASSAIRRMSDHESEAIFRLKGRASGPKGTRTRVYAPERASCGLQRTLPACGHHAAELSTLLQERDCYFRLQAGKSDGSPDLAAGLVTGAAKDSMLGETESYVSEARSVGLSKASIRRIAEVRTNRSLG
jgi:hypothetical protein